MRLIIVLISIEKISLKKKKKESITLAYFIHSLNPLKKKNLFIYNLIVTRRGRFEPYMFLLKTLGCANSLNYTDLGFIVYALSLHLLHGEKYITNNEELSRISLINYRRNFIQIDLHGIILWKIIRYS